MQMEFASFTSRFSTEGNRLDLNTAVSAATETLRIVRNRPRLHAYIKLRFTQRIMYVS